MNFIGGIQTIPLKNLLSLGSPLILSFHSLESGVGRNRVMLSKIMGSKN